MTQLETVRPEVLSMTHDDDWEIEIATNPESEEKLITFWLLTPDGERQPFLTICEHCLPSLIRVFEMAAAELQPTN